jgi:hypothetical protein
MHMCTRNALNAKRGARSNVKIVASEIVEDIGRRSPGFESLGRTSYPGGEHVMCDCSFSPEVLVS